MTAKYWTRTGEDIWSVTERRVFDFKNLETGEVISCQSVTEVTGHGLVPVTMPAIKTKPKEKSQSPARRGPKTKYKGVSPAKKAGKWRVCFWDKETNRSKYIGTFNSELQAAAAYEDHIGNHKEAQRLLNEYQEGNCGPEVLEPQEVNDPGKFPSE